MMMMMIMMKCCGYLRIMTRRLSNLTCPYAVLPVLLLLLIYVGHFPCTRSQEDNAGESQKSAAAHHYLKLDNKHNHMKHIAHEKTLHRQSIYYSWEKLNISVTATRDVKICFYNNDASERGVTNSMYDYADYSELFLKMKPHIIFPRIIEHASSLLVNSDDVGIGNRIQIHKFIERFPVSFCGELLTDKLWSNISQLTPMDPPYKLCPDLSQEALQIGCQVLYIQKGGLKAHNPVYPGSFSGKIPTLVHSVFNWDPHGTVYAAISSSIKGYSPRQNGNILPYIVFPPSQRVINLTLSFRKKLNIPKEALVLCRHGSSQTFDIWYVKSAIISLIEKYNSSQLHFLFLDTPKFQKEVNVLMNLSPYNLSESSKFFGEIKTEYNGYSNIDIVASEIAKSKKTSFPSRSSLSLDSSSLLNRQQMKLLQQIHFLNVTTNEDVKEQFYKTCNAMLHARSDGETFGLAVAEMSIRNKPVITQGRVRRYADSHLKILGEKGFYYRSEADVIQIVSKFVDEGISKDVDFNCYRDYYPNMVMKSFKNMFLDLTVPSVVNASSFDYHKTTW